MKLDDEIFHSVGAYVDADFFKMFTYEFIHGSAEALTDKNKIIISDKLAIKYFGSENAVNKVISHLVNANLKKEFEVVGVYKMPKENSSFDDDLYALYENYWDVSPELETGASWKMRNTVFVLVPDAARVATVEQHLQPYAENNNKVREDFLIQRFKLDAFDGMAVRDVANNVPSSLTREATPLSAVIGCAVNGILVLLIACFNLTNTAIALSSKRLKEIGIRKVMGSKRVQLILQYIGETLVICFIALLFGIALAETFLLPSFNQLWPYMKLESDYFGKPDFLIFMVGILFFTGVVAGSYPALYVSKFQPTAILKGKLQFGGNNFVTYILLGTQLILSLAGIVCAFAFVDNAKYQRDFDLGFNKDGVISSYVDGRLEYEAFRNALAGNPDIISISGTPHHVNSSFYNDPVAYEGQEIETNILDAGDDYVKTVGMTLLEGRDFTKDSETDRKESVLVTQEFVRQYGWDKPIGKQIIWMDTVKLYVVGVIKDVYSLWEPLEPMMVRYAAPDKVNYIVVHTTPDKLNAVNAYMEQTWKATFPNRLYASRFLNAGAVEAGNVNKNILIMFVFQGIVSLLLSITGLYTLVSLNIIKRLKEIGMRKIMGASIANISRIINTQFSFIVMIACLAGAYLGASLSDLLMRSIWEHSKRTTLISMIISCVVLIVVCVLSVAYKTYQTARMNPVDVLRSE